MNDSLLEYLILFSDTFEFNFYVKKWKRNDVFFGKSNLYMNR